MNKLMMSVAMLATAALVGCCSECKKEECNKKECAQSVCANKGCNEVAFDKQADFAGLYLHKGTKIAIEGRILTGSYTNKDGQKVYTTDVVVSNHEFCESRQQNESNQQQAADNGDFHPVDEHLPWD